jgi:hypothetical protein
MAVPHLCHSSHRLSYRIPLVRSKLCRLLELLEPDRRSIPIRTILTPSRPVDQCSGDPLQPKFEERALVDFEQPVGNMDWEIGVGPDQVASKAHDVERYLPAEAPVDGRSRSAQMRTRVIRSKGNRCGAATQAYCSARPELCLTPFHCSSACQSDRQRLPMRYPEIRPNPSIDLSTGLSR